MKSFFLIAFTFAVFSVSAKTYYFASNGSDANNGTSATSPWKTLTKFNSVFNTLSAGDYVLFNRGDVFYGNLVITKSGSMGAPITIGAYGSGANPVITGFTNVAGWTNLGNNIWESSSTISSLSGCNMVVINGNQVAMGRYPNSGYLTYQSFSGNTSITSSSINSGTTDWTGAEAVIRKNDWVLDRCIVKSHSGSTINYTDSYTSDIAIANYGFFIQNDSRTLDQQNEWYYSSSTKKIRVYSTSTPGSVQASTVSNLFSNNGFDYITVDGLSFTGSSDNAIYFGNSSADYCTIQNCTINFAGQNGIFLINGKNCLFNNNTISNCNRAGIESDAGSGNTFSNNVITNMGMVVGQAYDGTHTDGIYASSSNVTIKNNTIKNAGYAGIYVSSLVGSANVLYNYIDGTCMILDDAGGIYTTAVGSGVRTFDHNIILNTVGNREGTNSTNKTVASGIYLDEYSSNVTVTNNTIANGLNCGIKMHKASNNIVSNNTSFNNGISQIYFQNATSSAAIYGNVMNSNIFFSKASTQYSLNFVSITNDIANFGKADSNYYARPVNDNNSIINTYQPNTNYVNRTLSSWQSFTGQDVNGHSSPKTITNVNDVRFEYNATTSPKTIVLDGNYIDAKNVSYNGSITLAPYTSAVLIRNGAITNQSPTANAGTDQSITLPTNSINLSGSGTDPDGSISSYKWTKISGPSAGTISNANSASTSITGLAEGVFKFELKVTDNGGLTATDTVQITVNPASNILPVANAGSDITITLPANIISLIGSGSDADGTIVNYAWTKISGPSSYNIASSSSAVTNVSNLIQGTYQFELKVTDNKGGSAKDTIQVTVNAAANVTPTADAGTDQSITLPVNSVSLNGTGNDPDGSISAYNWIQITGPSSATITNANSSSTSVTAFVEGVYQFQLKVTDNGGLTDVDIVQVTVYAANNLSPVANAGSDIAITLPTNTVSLAGSGSDPDGTILSYSWTKISGPSSFNFVNASSPVTDVFGLVQGVYQFELKVTDNKGATGSDIVQLTVNAAANILPTVNAGVDESITLPTNTVSLNGNASDPDGSISIYRWKQISGPSASTITNSGSASTMVTTLVEGVYKFELKVTDNVGASARDTIQITVNAANIIPVANAGADISITLPANTVSLAGSGSDPDGTIASYKWTKISGPSSYTIVNPLSPVTDVYGLVEGVYQFELRVTDNNGDTGADILQVTVNAIPNQAPVSDAGADQSIKLPTNTVGLSGSGTDPDGSISSYTWAKISGPSAGTIANANSASTSVTGLTEGIYEFQLKVTDNNGATGVNAVQITVFAANITPTANAGVDKSITLPINTINLSGSGTDPDGIISSYDWTQISGPSSGSITNSKIASTSVTGMVEGVYEFRLRVTDNDGATDEDIVRIVVNPEPNIAPTANAGKDQIITLPINITSLAGNGSDPDGTIVNYKWSKLSGPVSYNIVNTASPVTDVSALSQGVYQFELKVTDNDGAIDIDTVQVLVKAAPNMPPVADAGRDQAINLPVGNTMLAGTASDADGIIKSYKWSKISGPALTIVSPKLKSTTVTGLAIGTYKIELMVTDNAGAAGRDTVILNVSQGTLPLNLLSFKGQLINEKVGLTWKTANERNVLGFEIERMTGTKWEKIGNVKSAIGGISGNNYSFSDYKPVTGINYYRLKIVDVDGKYVYSDIVNVELKPNKNVVYQNVPNPFSNTTTIRYEIAEKDLVKIVVYNSTGAQVAVLVNEQKEAGTYQVKWDAANFSSGNYFYRVIIGDNVTTKQMIKIK